MGSHHLDNNIIPLKLEMHMWNKQWCLFGLRCITFLSFDVQLFSCSHYIALSQRYQKLASSLVCNILQRGIIIINVFLFMSFQLLVMQFWLWYCAVSNIYHIKFTLPSSSISVNIMYIHSFVKYIHVESFSYNKNLSFIRSISIH